MIKPDSIQSFTDSLKLVQADSLARVDSLAQVDSLHAADSIRNVIRLTRGFVGTPPPSLPQTEAWVFIWLVVLFFFLVYSITRSGSFFSESVKNFFQAKERYSIFSKATVNDLQIRLLFLFFAIGVLSLYCYFLFHDPSKEFSLLKFLLFWAITGVFFGIKSLLIDIIGYVFLDERSLKMAKDSYFNIVSLLGLILFPLLIFQIFMPYNLNNFIATIGLITFILAYILIIFKLFQIFFHKIVASFYILLYLCTLEFLPIFVLYKVYEFVL